MVSSGEVVEIVKDVLQMARGHHGEGAAGQHIGAQHDDIQPLEARGREQRGVLPGGHQCVGQRLGPAAAQIQAQPCAAARTSFGATT